MDSVNDIHRGRVNFLPGTLFRSSTSSATRAPRCTRLASSSVKRSRSVKRARVLAVVVVAAVVAGVLASASADLENSIYTSKTDRLRLVVPRGWRATDEPSYPGLLLWMMRSAPEGRIVLTSEPFTRDVYCSWPVRCQMSHDTLPAKLACALGEKLAAQRLHVGPVQAGPKENEDAGLPSVWFEYDDGHHFLRQALAIDEDRVVSLVLSAPTIEARNAHVRAFEQALRTLRPLNAEELGIGSAAPAAGSAGSGSGSGSGAGAGSGSGAGSGAGSATMFVSAPPPRIEPIGPCTRK
jgi:hypothetical protein